MNNDRIDWLGSYPSDWQVLKNKAIFKNTSIKNHGDDVVLSLYREYGVIPKDSREDNHNVTSLDTDSYKYVSSGDLVINKMKAWQGSLAISELDGIVSPAYYVCKTDDSKVDLRFIHHYLRNQAIVLEYEKYSAGMRIGQWDLSIDDFLRIDIALPPVDEQKRIALLIDERCNQIDALIANEQAQIEKLKQYKQSLITEVVTKGLDPTVPMKNSGVEWIGTIPALSQVIKLKYCTYIRARLGWKGLKADEYVESGYPFLSAFNIVNSKLDYSEVNYINEFRYEESPEIKLKNDDILIVKDGAGIGKLAIVEDMPIPSTPNGSLAVISVLNSLIPKYLYYFLLSSGFQYFIDRIKAGMGVPHLFQSDLKEVEVVSHSYEEQLAMIKYLDVKCSAIDQLLSLKQSKIEQLTQYKKSLIYEYVTGKKEA